MNSDMKIIKNRNMDYFDLKRELRALGHVNSLSNVEIKNCTIFNIPPYVMKEMSRCIKCEYEKSEEVRKHGRPSIWIKICGHKRKFLNYNVVHNITCEDNAFIGIGNKIIDD